MSIHFFLLTNNETRVQKLDCRKLDEDILTFYPNVSLPCCVAGKMQNNFKNYISLMMAISD